jgi:hypothetical protein
MAENNDLDFNSLFEDESSKAPESGGDDFSFDFEADRPEIAEEADFEAEIPDDIDVPPPPKRRSSQDFEPDMDSLLITAQSPMIIEAMKNLTKKDYTSKTLAAYIEAIRGIDLYLKIIQRNPKNYYNLSDTINNDIDCKEVEKIAFNLFRTKYHSPPVTEDHIMKSYELFREKLKVGFDKAMISKSSVDIKQYFLMSGGVNSDIVDSLIRSSDSKFKNEMESLNHRVKSAMAILKSHNPEIAKGLKGKDVNIFIIKSTQLLSYYYRNSGKGDIADYYNRMHNMYKKYQIIRD